MLKNIFLEAFFHCALSFVNAVLSTYFSPHGVIIAKKSFICLEQGQGDIPTFYTYEEGLSHLTAEGQATLERLEGMLSQSVSSQYNMAGVRTEDSIRDYEGKYLSFYQFEQSDIHLGNKVSYGETYMVF